MSSDIFAKFCFCLWQITLIWRLWVFFGKKALIFSSSCHNFLNLNDVVGRHNWAGCTSISILRLCCYSIIQYVDYALKLLTKWKVAIKMAKKQGSIMLHFVSYHQRDIVRTMWHRLQRERKKKLSELPRIKLVEEYMYCIFLWNLEACLLKLNKSETNVSLIKSNYLKLMITLTRKLIC